MQDFLKDIIVVRLKGGFGNQLFQYAFGYNLAKKKNAHLVLDSITYLNSDPLRNYGLHNLNIPNKHLHTKAQKKLFLLARKLLKFSKPHVHHEIQDFIYSDTVLEYSGDIILDGYFQNERYFSNSRSDLIHIFEHASHQFKDQDIYKKIINKNSIALHIRRGDYVQNKTTNEFHGTCDLSYFEQAQELFNNTQPTYFIFTDDIEWAKENLKINQEHYFIHDYIQNDFNEFILMMHCKHYIISNSTFSWWAAWLCTNENKKIVCPKRWFKNDKLNLQANNLIPNDWIRI
jgi:hypothetical protein